MRSLVLLLAALSVSCSASKPGDDVARALANQPVHSLQTVPRLGDHLPVWEESRIHTIAQSAQTWPSYEVDIDGVRFTIGVDHEYVVRYVATSDERFVSPEGLKVLMPMKQALDVAHEAPVLERGWGHYVRLPSGWYAYLDDHADSPNLGTRVLRDDAYISMFFMR